LISADLYLCTALNLVSSDPKEPFTESSLEIPLFGIDGSLERLEKVAAVIIQATQDSLIKRAIVFIEKQKDVQDVIKNFSWIILWRYSGLRPRDDETQQVPLVVTKDHIPAKEKVLVQHPEGLFLALVKTSIVRHYRILYERSRNKKEKREPAAPAVSAPELSLPQGFNPPEGDTVPRQANHIQSNERAPDKANQTAEPSDEAQSETQPTVLSINVADYNAEIARIGSGSTNAHEKPALSISEAGMAAFPREPKIPDGHKTGTCPICRQEFPTEKLKGANWR
jgi:hypothetical protein